MWCRNHKESEHWKSNNGYGNGNANPPAGDSNMNKGKFNNNKRDSDKDKSKGKSNEPSISVDRKLFSAIRNNSNVSSFLSKIKDDSSSVKGQA